MKIVLWLVVNNYSLQMIFCDIYHLVLRNTVYWILEYLPLESLILDKKQAKEDSDAHAYFPTAPTNAGPQQVICFYYLLKYLLKNKSMVSWNFDLFFLGHTESWCVDQLGLCLLLSLLLASVDISGFTLAVLLMRGWRRGDPHLSSTFPNFSLSLGVRSKEDPSLP